jgi:ABC-type Mn2+/Zn2+ transport system permease subunit
MLAMIALAVVISFQTVGTMLVFGMLLAPAGAAAMIARRIRSMMIISALIGMVSVFTGLLVSYYFNFSAGPSIVLAASAVFFLVLIGKNIQTSLRLRAEAAQHG